MVELLCQTVWDVTCQNLMLMIRTGVCIQFRMYSIQRQNKLRLKKNTVKCENYKECLFNLQPGCVSRKYIYTYTFRFNLFISASVWMERASSIGRKTNIFILNMQSKQLTSPWLPHPRANETLLRPNIKVILLLTVCICHEHPRRLSTVIRQHSQHTICSSVLMKGVGQMPTSRSGFSMQSAHVCQRTEWLQSLSSTSCETPCVLWLSLRWPCTPCGPICLSWGLGQLLVNNEYVNEENVFGMTK